MKKKTQDNHTAVQQADILYQSPRTLRVQGLGATPPRIRRRSGVIATHINPPPQPPNPLVKTQRLVFISYVHFCRVQSGGSYREKSGASPVVCVFVQCAVQFSINELKKKKKEIIREICAVGTVEKTNQTNKKM